MYTVMAKEIESGTPSSSVSFAFELMYRGGFRHIPLIDRKNKPAGMLSIRDLFCVLADVLVKDLQKNKAAKSTAR